MLLFLDKTISSGYKSDHINLISDCDILESFHAWINILIKRYLILSTFILIACATVMTHSSVD
jgi:hypothetical protein